MIDMSDPEAVANLLADTEEKRRAELDDARTQYLEPVRADVDAAVARAESAWADGAPFLLLKLPAEITPAMAAVLGEEHVHETEEVWADALARVTAIGWQLRKWELTHRDGLTKPMPLFERPES